jgi:hypothetical protein
VTRDSQNSGQRSACSGQFFKAKIKELDPRLRLAGTGKAEIGAENLRSLIPIIKGVSRTLNVDDKK